MNPYYFKAACDVCGGEGVTDKRGNAAQWTRGGFVSHSDPRVCQAILAEKKRELDKLADDLKEKVK